jgi:CBS domain-containing protein
MTNIRLDVHTSLGQVDLRAPVTVSRDATLREVATAMEDGAVSWVLVGEDPSWLITERDLVGGVAAGMSADAPVWQLSSRQPVWASPTTHVVDALRMMAEHRIRHLVVVDEAGRAVGVLSVEDLLPAFAE